MSSHAAVQIYTFLFTDLEGSTLLWERHPEAMRTALARHDALLREAVERSHGRVVKSTGDGLWAVFDNPLDGLTASLEVQRSLRAETWGETGPLQVRTGLHVGQAEPRGGDYYGPAVNRAARLMAAAHGGQLLISRAAASLLADQLPQGVTLRDLGVHRLKDLTQPEQIFQVVHPTLADGFPPLLTLDQRQQNLPAQPTALVGREVELHAVLRRLEGGAVRLVTLTGPGGIGKTRLALQAAAELVDRFSDGVYFIDLARVTDSRAVPAAIARTLRIREAPDRSTEEDLIAALEPRSTLLLLDNFEQVIPAASFVAELLQRCPHVQLLVTSREALRVRGEMVFPVPPLAFPTTDAKRISIERLCDYEAVRLFTERAQAVDPAFQLTSQTAPLVAEISRRLDGLPLAIELAAARIPLFSPRALLERLEGSLLLRRGARDLPARHQTLHDAIDWSYGLLDPGEQRLFRLLSVFVGSTPLTSVEEVAERVGVEDQGPEFIDALGSLVEKSLVSRVALANGEIELSMLGTIREFAVERLREDPGLSSSARQEHAAHFADVTRRRWSDLAGGLPEEALAALGRDIENIRAAWSYWLERRDLEQLRKLVDGLWLLYDRRAWYQASVDLINDLLGALDSSPSSPDQAETAIVLQTSLARALFMVRGYTPEVEEAYTRALEHSLVSGEAPLIAPILKSLSSIYTLQGEFAKGARAGERILALAEELDDDGMRVDGYLAVGENLAFLGEVANGVRNLERGIAVHDSIRQASRPYRLGSKSGVACRITAALFHWMLGSPDLALARAEEAIRLAERLDHPYSMAYAWFHCGILHLWRGEPERARSCASRALELAGEHEMKLWTAAATCSLGAAMSAAGEGEEGLELILHGMELYRGMRTPPVFWPVLLHLLAGVYARKGRPGDGLTALEEAIHVASSWPGSTLVPFFLHLKGELLLAASPENASEAESCHRQALAIAAATGTLALQLRAASSLCRLWRDRGEQEEGRSLLEPIYGRFTEGFETADLAAARELLDGS